MNSQKIAILTDSCADLTEALIADYPIYVVPLKIRCADGEFDDGVTIHARDVYARLEMGQLPKTSLPAGEKVEQVLRQIYADGYEKIIAIPLSSGLSGTYNLIRLAAGALEGKLEMKVYDSLSGALGHYSAGFTLSTYTHATAEMKRDAADTIGNVISQAM